MTIKIKHTLLVCVYDDPLGYNTYYWPLEPLLHVIESINNTDWLDDTHELCKLIDGNYWEFTTSLVWGGILDHYEDDLYLKGPNFEKFEAYIKGLEEVQPEEVEL